MLKNKNNIVSNNIIGKAYYIVEDKGKILHTYFVHNENNNLVFSPFFSRNIEYSIEKEIIFLENNGYKSINYWTKQNKELPKSRKRIFK